MDPLLPATVQDYKYSQFHIFDKEYNITQIALLRKFFALLRKFFKIFEIKKFFILFIQNPLLFASFLNLYRDPIIDHLYPL